MNVTACNKQAEGHFIRQEGRELAGDTGAASVRKESDRPKANTGSNILRQKMGAVQVAGKASILPSP